MKTRLDLTFPHQYEVDLEAKLPPVLGKIKQFYYPGGVERGGRGGLVVKIMPHQGLSWIGTFASGYNSPVALTGIFAYPDEQFLCVVSAGAGYIVRADDPKSWEQVRAYPITDARTIPEKQLLVFADFTALSAYGPEGMVWTIDDLSWDGLEITEVSPGFIRGLAWDSPRGQKVEFWVDVLTGRHKGGSSPTQYAGTHKMPASSAPKNNLKDRVIAKPTISHPKDIFNLVTYKELLSQARNLRKEIVRIRTVMQTYPIEERLSSPECQLLKPLHAQFKSLTREYHARLPIHTLAQCPYCGTTILQPVDSFSLMSFDPHLNATKAYCWGREWYDSSLPGQRCSHALCATLSVNLNGLKPDDMSGWMMGKETVLMRSAPYVMVWPLIAQYTSAVLHALPIGRLDDNEPIHRYTAYFSTYFANSTTNLFNKEMWVPNDLGGPAMGLVQVDLDLIKWVKAGRLFWLDPDDQSRLIQGPVEAFPYANIEPKGWYHTVRGVQMDGPHPYHTVWQGTAPEHDESFPKTIE
ncbi:MAG: hypothetical protein GY847_17110 [Proteobacteria bacterium]|nr:hypothetical protein [Pseudomonadota bacterium]